MKNNKLFLLLALFLCSCSSGYKQDYADFNSYNKANLRNKGWFPNIIDSSAYSLKSISYIDELADIGTFRYSKDENYDKIFNDVENRIHFSEFEIIVNKYKKQVPNWFLDKKNVDTTNFETIKKDRFYITRNKQEKRVYFILAN